ncbi:MAG: MotA/TolQ/ExbB proton channel family protein [Epsilonproteobacteria bacterium]|nr:MAG: MotA/TolQ/ExbB proton channel family protein [Campylobacterota bacterium]
MNIAEYIDRGGLIVYILLVLNIVGFAIILWKVFIFSKVKYDTISKDVLDDIHNNSEIVKLTTIKSSIYKQMQSLEVGINTIKTIASIAPLLGLLGTVVGVLGSFDNITMSGLDDPTVFSDGISVALITTVAGMIVAIPHYVAYNYFIGFLDKIQNNIESKVLSSL